MTERAPWVHPMKRKERSPSRFWEGNMRTVVATEKKRFDHGIRQIETLACGHKQMRPADVRGPRRLCGTCVEAL
jgi:hypothetical protein